MSVEAKELPSVTSEGIDSVVLDFVAARRERASHPWLSQPIERLDTTFLDSFYVAHQAVFATNVEFPPAESVGWREDYHHEDAHWVFPHLLAGREVDLDLEAAM
jgi:hypothetical protein